VLSLVLSSSACRERSLSLKLSGVNGSCPHQFSCSMFSGSYHGLSISFSWLSIVIVD
jgi:hypothetical protein